MPGLEAEPQISPMPPASLRQHSWCRFLRGPDSELLEKLYVPALSEAVRYDRCCSYFSSSVLAAAARGFARLIERLISLGDKAPRPAGRLVVNEELSAEDVRAMTEAGDLSKLEEVLLRRFKNPKDILEKNRLSMLGWLVKHGLLEVRVGVMRNSGGIVHAKFGIVTDQSNEAVVFSGSGNESAQGLRANYERLEVSSSWTDPDRLREYTGEFEALWKNTHPDVYTVTLPEALRLKLIKFAPKEPPVVEPSTALARQKAAMVWRFIVEAPYLPNGAAACDATAIVDPWPHQRRVVEETAEAWPEGRLLCDEVGMGKTIEAILILRRLLAGRGVRRALLLLPAGIVKQWQGELREKGGMIFPRLEGVNTLVWPDDRAERVEGLPEALKEDVLLMSRETARTENNLPHLLAAEPWDLVLLDEAHAARRRKQEEGEFNSPTLLLNLLRELQLRGRARGILLLSATPMQTHPWEPWDLLSVLGEGGAWLAEFSAVRDYYRAVEAVKLGQCDIETGRKAALLVASDPDFPKPRVDSFPLSDPDAVASKLSFSPPTQREPLAHWLRQASPLARRMHRSTRSTLRRYYELRLLADPPPRRVVEDVLFDFRDSAERDVYNSIGRYIEKRFQELEKEKPGKGFVMTVYRRRASSSPLALERSLERRREGLSRIADRKVFDPDLPVPDEPEALDADELPDVDVGGRVSAALPQDPQAARREIAEVERLLQELQALGGRDSKRDRFFDVFRKTTEDGRPVLVFTEYTDTMEYLRDSLGAFCAKSLGCYSGNGGQRWDGERWKLLTKGEITEALAKGELRALICTDAASEGLNLQAGGAVINYDLPWNPSRIEQRVGRIDRIGQKYSEVRVVNLFLKDSIDDRVYRVLRQRCGLFEHFVGAMQPVLARARRMLLGQEVLNPDDLRATATHVERDPLAQETYIESGANAASAEPPALSRERVRSALTYLNGDFGFSAKTKGGVGRYQLSGPEIPRTVLSCELDDLERDRSLLPLSPLEPRLRASVDGLFRPGERLPLVIGSCQQGAFRTSVAYWLGERALDQLESFDDLVARVEVWDSKCPGPEQWEQAVRAAQNAAAEQGAVLEKRASERERKMDDRQIQAARLRLKRELGRYLVCVNPGTSDLNEVLYQQMSRDIASAQRLKQCLEKLGGYPDWPTNVRRELEEFIQGLSENQRKARLLGSEIDAALGDPRWAVELQR